MFIPGILPIWFAEFFRGRGLLRLAAFGRRCVGIFIPGMFIPGLLPMSCFLAVLLLGSALQFLGAAFRLAFGLDFGIFIPGMFCISWLWAEAVVVTIGPVTKSAPIAHALIKALKLNLCMIPFRTP